MQDRFRFVKDTELKYIGNSTKQKYMFALFECPYCHEIIETRKTIGLKQVCCKKCYSKYRKGKRYGNIKDKVNISGYFYIYFPSHPNATKKGYVAEHRLVAEKTIGRMLTKNEDVHHINGIKTDNRPENLLVLTHSEHIKLHKETVERDERGKFKISI